MKRQLPYLSGLGNRKNLSRENKNFHGAIQSNHVVSAGFSHVEFLLFWRQLSYYIVLQAAANFDSNLKNKFLKSLCLISFTWILLPVFVLNVFLCCCESWPKCFDFKSEKIVLKGKLLIHVDLGTLMLILSSAYIRNDWESSLVYQLQNAW